MGKEEQLPVVQGTAVAELQQTVQIIAPADLPEGYQFIAEKNGQQFQVKVPSGGVKEGQEFTANVQTSNNNVPSSSEGVFGRWKDGLCSCCSYGLCHAHLCLACFCGPIALAQIMTRMRLTWLGERGPVRQVARTFKTILIIFIVALVLDQALALAVIALYPELIQDDESSSTVPIPIAAIVMQYVREAIQILFGVYLLVATCRTRKVVREQYHIPERNCGSCGDCCSSFWCQCCVTMQMMRHTADYDTYAATCCTETGLPAHVV